MLKETILMQVLKGHIQKVIYLMWILMQKMVMLKVTIRK